MLRIVGLCLVAYGCAGAPVATAFEHAAHATTVARAASVVTKWQDAQRRLIADAEQLAACRAEVWMCSDSERRLEAIVDIGRSRDGRARIGEVNRAINLAIRPASDARRFGVSDHWSSPLETMTDSAGDCEDYAILKLLALREAGIPQEHLRLVIVRDRNAPSAHAVAAVWLQEQWLILDNRSLILVDLASTHYRILVQLDQSGEPRYAWGSEPRIALAHNIM